MAFRCRDGTIANQNAKKINCNRKKEKTRKKHTQELFTSNCTILSRKHWTIKTPPLYFSIQYGKYDLKKQKLKLKQTNEQKLNEQKQKKEQQQKKWEKNFTKY